jgi:hypothetical protein
LGCRCDHAASSSGRFQSSARTGSLNNAVSAMVGSSTIVTMARHGWARRTGLCGRPWPSLRAA